MLLWSVLLIALHFAAANLPHSVHNSRILNATAGYCNERQFTTVYRNITSTRVVTRKKGLWPFRKIIKDLEHFNETVPHTVGRTLLRCCEGYKQTEQKHCVPQCQAACPSHADCIAPNTCRCQHGYQEIREEAAALQCLPPSIKVETEATETTTEYAIDYDSYTWESNTDKGLEPIADCRISDCPEFAKCLENGTCVCFEGFVWHEQRSSIPNESGMQLDVFCLHENLFLEAREADSFSGFLFKVAAILTGVALAVGLSAILIWRYKVRAVQINVEDGNCTDKNAHCKYVSDKEEAAACVVY